jgi:hypothetical protein
MFARYDACILSTLIMPMLTHSRSIVFRPLLSNARKSSEELTLSCKASPPVRYVWLEFTNVC